VNRKVRSSFVLLASATMLLSLTWLIGSRVQAQTSPVVPAAGERLVVFEIFTRGA